MASVDCAPARVVDIYEFEDARGVPCSLQKLATFKCVWFGNNQARAPMTKEMVCTLLRFLKPFAKKGDIDLSVEKSHFQKEGFTIAKNTQNRYELQFKDSHHDQCTLQQMHEEEKPVLLFNMSSLPGKWVSTVLDQSTTARLLPFLERFAIYGCVREEG